MSLFLEDQSEAKSLTKFGTSYIKHEIFWGQGAWPTSTSILCFHCCESFTDFPIPMVLARDPKTKIWEGHGVYCTFSCVKGEIRENPKFNSSLILMLLHQMAREVFGYFGDIQTAAPRSSLKKFGGPFTIDQMRSFVKEKIQVTQLQGCLVDHIVLYDLKKAEERVPQAKSMFETEASETPLPEKKKKKEETKKPKVKKLSQKTLVPMMDTS